MLKKRWHLFYTLLPAIPGTIYRGYRYQKISVRPPQLSTRRSWNHTGNIGGKRMTFDARAFLKNLRREVETHPAVNHTFLARIGTSPFSREDYKVFGMQHYPLVGMFTNYMERLLVNAPNSTAKCWLAKVLVDEYGEGSDGHDHAHMYRMYLTACGVQAEEENRVPLHPAVVDFIRTHLEVCSRRPFLVGLGALGPGHEWAIPRMFVPIIKGQRRAGFTEEEFSISHCIVSKMKTMHFGSKRLWPPCSKPLSKPNK